MTRPSARSAAIPGRRGPSDDVENTPKVSVCDPLRGDGGGYVPVSPTGYPVVYYVNPTIVAGNAAAKKTLDPHSIDGLVYAQTPDGTEVLAAAMEILPTTPDVTADAVRLPPAVASAHRCLRPVNLGDRCIP